MANLSNYKGSTTLISGLTPKNGGDFPLMEAHDIVVDNAGTRLNAKLESLENALASYTDEIDELVGGGL